MRVGDGRPRVRQRDQRAGSSSGRSGASSVRVARPGEARFGKTFAAYDAAP